ncbi:MAG: TMEM43 family protein [Candidatus Uhrbacteria bacterium]
MPDKFTETKTIGLGSRMGSSVKNVFLGLLMFVASFGVLYWNEGRIDLSSVANQAVEISSESANTDTSLNGKLVSLTGSVTTAETVGDDWLLVPGPYLAVDRVVEMYAWVEKTEEKEQSNLGGSQTVETTYSYVKEWKTDPASSSGFKYSEGHVNPTMSSKGGEYVVNDAKVGVYSIDPGKIDLPEYSDLSLEPEMLNLEDSSATLANDQYLYLPYSTGSTLNSPQVGDVRVSYKVLEPGFDGTVFGKLKGSQIDPYFDQDQNELYRLFAGTRDEAIATLHGEFVMMLWLMRLLGFILMWGGLTALFGPFTTLLDIIPILGSLGRGVVGAVMFVVALVLAAITIVISMIVHNIVALIVVIVLSLAGLGYVMNILRKKLKDKEPGGLGGLGGIVGGLMGKK